MAEKAYENVKIAVDPVIFTIHNNRLKVLLHLREKAPFKGRYELPGGLLIAGETAEETLKRKLHQLTGYKEVFFTQFFTFTAPSRDPRNRVASIGYVALINDENLKNPADWAEFDTLPKLAFDHNDIIQKARQYIRENVTSTIVKQFMPELFPLNNLHDVFELIEQKKYDNRNFRKKMLSSGVLEETDELESGVSHRPAKLFRFR